MTNLKNSDPYATQTWAAGLGQKKALRGWSTLRILEAIFDKLFAFNRTGGSKHTHQKEQVARHYAPVDIVSIISRSVSETSLTVEACPAVYARYTV